MVGQGGHFLLDRREFSRASRIRQDDGRELLFLPRTTRIPLARASSTIETMLFFTSCDVDAVFAATDVIAISAIRALAASGLPAELIIRESSAPRRK